MNTHDINNIYKNNTCFNQWQAGMTPMFRPAWIHYYYYYYYYYYNNNNNNSILQHPYIT